MEARPSDVREAILERVFPELRYGGDPDIERYFDLRAAGRMLDALAIYRSRLRPRYPDDEKRIVLLKLYRTRSPAFPDFLRGLLHERADEIVDRLKANIDAVVAPLSGVPMRDTYAVLKAVERVARLLPDDSDDARRMAWTYADYAKLLGHRKAETERAAFLLGEFYDQASIDEDAPTDFVAASLAEEESKSRRAREDEKKNFFDLAKIEFDESDVRRIEIPTGLERDEDIVLAYCHKYWLRADDPAFERIVWLYSKKYGTKNYEVLKAIKTGRAKKYQDDDILTMVGTTIATRYSYTVQGDIYMQAAWRRIKASLYGQVAQAATAQAVAKQPVATKPVAASTIPARAPAPARSPAPNTATRPATPRSSTGPAPASHRPTPSTIPAPVTAKPVQGERSGREPRASRLSLAPKASPLLDQRRKDKRRDERVPELRAAGSISDRIKRLSGRAYDVYKEIFLSRVRAHIRAELQKNRVKHGGVFRDDSNSAENIVYDFMERNYANAYMDWVSSEHRTRVRELGFELESLDGIIEACYRKIEA